MSSYAAYWQCDPADAPALTGAASVMDCSDIQEVLLLLSIPLAGKRILDVGCGTGRIAQLTDGPGSYMGLDVSPGMVEHALGHGLSALLIDGPDSFPFTLSNCGDLIACLSVFTHIPRGERQAYLRAFHKTAPELLVDIIPGNGEGSIAHWTAHPGDFRQDLDHAGWTVAGEYGRTAPDGTTHLYFHCRRDVPRTPGQAGVDAGVPPVSDPPA